MKLATLKSEKRDGTLIVVSKDLTRAVKALDIATTLQKALEDWRHTAPKLEMVYKQLCAGTVPDSFQFDPRMVLSPLPRAYQWLDASAYLPHIERVRKSRGQDVPENVHTDVIMYQGGSDHFLAPRQDIPYDCAEDWGADFEAEIAVVTDDVPMGVSVDDAAHHIKLVMLCNDVSLRNLAKTELAKGFGFVQAKPPSSFAPVAVSVHELGRYWQGGKLHLPVRSFLNGEWFGEPDAGEGMLFSFPQLIAHAARTRPLIAGTIIGSGTVSNEDRAKGYSCILERRTIEKLEEGVIRTPFLHSGDTVKIDILDDYHNSIFGAIQQTIVPYKAG